MPLVNQPKTFDSIEDIKEAIEWSKEEFKKIRRHFERVEELYGDFEDMVVKLEKRLYDLQNDIESDDVKELKAKVDKVSSENEALRKQTKKAKKFEEAEDIFDLIPDIETKEDNSIEDYLNAT